MIIEKTPCLPAHRRLRRILRGATVRRVIWPY